MVEMIKEYFTRGYDLVNIVQYLVVSFSIVWVLSPGHRNRDSILRFIGKMAGVFGLETLVNLILFVLGMEWKWFGGLNYPVAHLIVVAIYAVFACKFKASNRLTLSLLIYFIIIDIAELGSQVARIVEFSFQINVDWMYILFYGLILIFAFVIGKYSIRNYSDMPVHLLILECTICTVSSALIFFHIVYARENHMRYDVFFAVVLFCLYIIAYQGYFFVRMASRERSERIAMEKDNLLLKANNTMLRLSEEVIRDMRAFRHDVQNQMAVMSHLFEEKKYDELESYFQKYDHSTEKLYSLLACGNPIIDSVMNMEISKARSLGVTLQAAISVPNTLPFDSPDTCCLIANILDNAIEEVARIKSDSPINFEMNVRGDYLYIGCRNHTSKKKGYVHFRTEKDDPTAHGIGHNIIDRMIKKYGGYINYAIENGTFIVDAVMDLKYAKEENV